MLHRPQRIAQILLSPRIGGAETLADSLAEYWAIDGHQSQIIYLDGSSKLSSLGRLISLRTALQDFRPDVVLAHSAIPNVFARLATRRGIPVVTVLHSATDDYVDLKLRVAERILAPRTAVVVAVSEAQRESYVRRFPSRLVKVIPNGLRPDLPMKGQYSSAPTKIVSIGRIARQKNPAQWVQIAEAMSDSVPHLEFEWFGPASDEPETKAIMLKAESGSRARFRGSTDDPGSALSGADIFLHTASREAHSIGIIEAAAVGLPIVCTDTVARTVSRTIPLHYYPDGDVAAAVAVIRQLISSIAVANASARQSVSRVRQEFDGLRCARAYINLFQDLGHRDFQESLG